MPFHQAGHQIEMFAVRINIYLKWVINYVIIPEINQLVYEIHMNLDESVF